MFLSILTFILVLSVLVLVHEAGHFFAAKKAGVKVEEFGFGIPPRVFGKKYGETIYSLNLLPFGGFVRLHGENREEEITEPKRAFLTQSKKKRTAIILAGVFMNFILAIVAFSVVYSFSGIPQETQDVRVVEVAEGSPAQRAGIREEEIVREVEGEKVNSVSEFVALVDESKGQEIILTLEKDGDSRDVSLTPREDPPANEGSIGVVISATEIYYPPIWQRPFIGIYYGFQEAVFWGLAVVGGFAQMIKNLFGGQVPSDVAGPVGIYALTTQAAQFGILSLVNFVGVLSINLAILNAIPFPALDGGRFLFIALEAVFGKKVLPKLEAWVHTVGIVILILLIIAITAADISKLISAGGVSGYLESIVGK